eukprot:scaffold910_cov396-Prasinococcus_capsulatus_cf.AAC.27
MSAPSEQGEDNTDTLTMYAKMTWTKTESPLTGRLLSYLSPRLVLWVLLVLMLGTVLRPTVSNFLRMGLQLKRSSGSHALHVIAEGEGDEAEHSNGVDLRSKEE